MTYDSKPLCPGGSDKAGLAVQLIRPRSRARRKGVIRVPRFVGFMADSFS
jgi:hypothetical protein